MTKYPFSKITDLWELFDYSDPITAYRDTFKDDLEFDIVELQTKYADEAKRIEDQMNGKKPEPSKRFFMGRADMAIESLSHRCIES